MVKATVAPIRCFWKYPDQAVPFCPRQPIVINGGH